MEHKEREWEAEFDAFWLKVASSLESVTHGNYDVEILTMRYKDWFKGDLEKFLNPLLTQAREDERERVVGEIKAKLPPRMQWVGGEAELHIQIADGYNQYQTEVIKILDSLLPHLQSKEV